MNIGDQVSDDFLLCVLKALQMLDKRENIATAMAESMEVTLNFIEQLRSRNLLTPIRDGGKFIYLRCKGLESEIHN